MARGKLNLRQWWDAVGTENVERVIDALGSSMGTFRLMRYGHKRPSGQTALRIIEKAELLTPACVPDLALLLRGVPKASKKVASKIPPSKSFVKATSQRARRAAVQ